LRLIDAQTQDCPSPSPAINLLLPSRIQQTLFKNFHAIRSREDLALMLFDWEFVNSEEDLFELFDLIHKINTTFERNRAIKKLDQAARAQESRRQKQLSTMDTGNFFLPVC